MDETLSVGVVGAGYWGPNLIRNFGAHPSWDMKWVADTNDVHLSKIGKIYPAIALTKDYRDLLKDAALDAVAIATPVEFHYDMVRAALEAGKHVLVEKPLTSTTEEARRLRELARSRGKTIMVDHTFLYNGAAEHLYQLASEKSFGNIFYVDSVRVNLGLFQNSDVIYDLAPHDVSIINYVLNEYPVSVNANAGACVYGDLYDVAFLTLRYPSGVLAHVHLSWLSPVKIRKLSIAGSNRMAIWDDVEPSEKVKVYDKGVELRTDEESVYRRMVSYRVGDMHAPALDTTEALTKVVNAFHRAITTGERTKATVDDGLAVVAVLEAAHASVVQRGATITLDYPAD